MIKKFFHCVCFLIASAIWLVLVALVLRYVMLYAFNEDPLSPETYARMSDYWNNGGVLKGRHILMLLLLVAYFPICCLGCYKLYHYKYMKLLTIPLNKIVNYGLDGYVAPDVNIKNLKIEEKKTLEQIVQERLNEEKKKNQQAGNPVDFRKNIIEKINEAKK
jgi:hypothetical protein